MCYCCKATFTGSVNAKVNKKKHFNNMRDYDVAY